MEQAITIIKWINWSFAIALSVFSLIFISYSIKEKEWRASILGFLFFGGSSAAWIAVLIRFKSVNPIFHLIILISFLFILFLLTAPLGSKKPLRIVGDQEKIDERDVIFSRYYALKPGSPHYIDYYQRNPQLKKIDEKTRSLPGLATSETPTYHRLAAPLYFADDLFIKEISNQVDGPAADNKQDIHPKTISITIKGMLKHLGADSAGITKLNQAYVYNIAGRKPERYGKKIELNHHFAIAFAIEMDYWMNKASPQISTALETNKQYLRAAWISIVLAKYIRSLGYSARAHIDANYQTILPPIAADAGLGEVGRIGILITKKYGPRVRLGLVTTDLPLELDSPVAFGVQDFCERCKKCADNCPSQAISRNEKIADNGVEKWVIHREKCFQYWNYVGTDCAVCIRVCPYSRPDNSLHNSIRFVNKQSVISRQISVWADDIFYGRKPPYLNTIEWLKIEEK